MKRGWFIFLLLIITASCLTVTVMAAGDEYPETCEAAPIVEPGELNPQMDTPNDVDVIRIEVTEADFLAISVSVPDEERRMAIYHSDLGAKTTLGSFSPGSAHRYADRGIVGGFSHGDDGTEQLLVPVSYKAFAEESGTMCIAFYEMSDKADFPYQYTVRFAKNSEPDWWLEDQQMTGVTPFPRDNPTDPPELETPTPIPETPTETSTPESTPGTAQSTPEIQQQTAEQQSPTELQTSQETDEVEPATEGGSGPGFGLPSIIGGGVVFLLLRRVT